MGEKNPQLGYRDMQEIYAKEKSRHESVTLKAPGNSLNKAKRTDEGHGSPV